MIMDEYDVLVREKKDDKVLANYLTLLNILFKSDNIDEVFALVCLTEIFPIIRDKFQSKLSNFTEYSITESRESRDLSGFFGFTEEEMKLLLEKELQIYC